MYETQSECENANPNSNCTQDVKCYKPYDCKDGYAKSVSGCKNPNGYTLGATDAYGCAECKEKECGSVWVYKPDYSSGSESSGMEYVDSSPDSSVEVCGNAGATGWKRTIVSGRFSGTEACYVCQRNNCPSGYITGRSSVADCGPGSWNFDIASTKSGDEICSKCTYSCVATCEDKYTGSLPANAYYTYETCTACGVTSQIKSGWACNSGYVKAGNTCQKAYASCSAANMSYLSSPRPDSNCKSTTIYLTSGVQKTCYYNCTCYSGWYENAGICWPVITNCDRVMNTKYDNIQNNIGYYDITSAAYYSGVMCEPGGDVQIYTSTAGASMWCCHGEYLGCNDPDKYFFGDSFKCLPASTEVCNALLYDCEQDCGVKYPDNYASDEYLNCLQGCSDSGSKYEECMSKIM